jgi:biopolymer transport protein ExbD
MRFKVTRALEHGKLDMTPMIDVVFLLLIFFMLTSTLVVPPAIKVQLPKAVTAKALEQKNLTVTITRNRELFIDSDKVTSSELKKLLKKAASLDKVLLIKADKEVPFEEVVSVWDLCRTTGITQISIATNP